MADFFRAGGGTTSAASPEFAPLCVPVELRPAGAQRAATGREGPRWFRLVTGVCEAGLRLRSALPDELRGTALSLRLQLPPPTMFAQDLPLEPGESWQGALAATAVPQEVVVRDGRGERAELRQLAFLRLTPAGRALIDQYVTLRALSTE